MKMHLVGLAYRTIFAKRLDIALVDDGGSILRAIECLLEIRYSVSVAAKTLLDDTFLVFGISLHHPSRPVRRMDDEPSNSLRSETGIIAPNYCRKATCRR